MTLASRKYAWYVLGLLTTINFVNYVDRMVIVSMYEPLRLRFHFSDAQLGAFWTAFFVVHAATTIPFGWASDHFDRRKIIAFGVIAWSLATLFSAWAVGFVSLLLLRGLVGVGEAAYGPVSNALLCESFRPDEKARTVAFFNGGMFAGACVGMVAGGLLGFPVAFQVVAVPGLVLGVVAATLRVKRHRVDDKPGTRPHFSNMLRDAVRSLSVPTLLWMLVAGVCISFAAGGYIAWFVNFVLRYKGLTLKQGTIIFGLIAVSGGITGVIAGGQVADFLQKRYRHGRILAIAIGFFASVPFALGAIFIDRGPIFYICSWLLMFFIPWYNGPMAAVIDDVVDDGDAATAQASFTFVLHLVGTGTASLVVGVASTLFGLRLALTLPTLATLFAGAACLMATRHVSGDMERRAKRAAPPGLQQRAAVL